MRKLLSILTVLASGALFVSCASTRGSSSPSPSPAASAAVAPAASFTDMSTYDGAQQINDLANLGVFDRNSGAFQPNKPISRAEFVRWLVKAHNAIIKEPALRIRLAQTATATFTDVPPGNPNFPFIQGLTNSGYVVGVDTTHFAPDKFLTREQLIFVKASLDEGHTISANGHQARELQYSDATRIGNKYLGAVYEDSTAATTQNFRRVYGTTTLFSPQTPVTRGEAAVALSDMKAEWPVSAAAALGRTPYP